MHRFASHRLNTEFLLFPANTDSLTRFSWDALLSVHHPRILYFPDFPHWPGRAAREQQLAVGTGQSGKSGK